MSLNPREVNDLRGYRQFSLTTLFFSSRILQDEQNCCARIDIDLSACILNNFVSSIICICSVDCKAPSLTMDRDKSVGKGRGSLLLEMMKREQKKQEERSRTANVPSHSLETPSISSAEQSSSFERHVSSQSQSSFTSSNVNTGRGRAQLVSLIKSQSSNLPESRGPSTSSGGSYGRGFLLSALTKNIG